MNKLDHFRLTCECWYARKGPLWLMLVKCRLFIIKELNKNYQIVTSSPFLILFPWSSADSPPWSAWPRSRCRCSLFQGVWDACAEPWIPLCRTIYRSWALDKWTCARSDSRTAALASFSLRKTPSQSPPVSLSTLSVATSPRWLHWAGWWGQYWRSRVCWPLWSRTWRQLRCCLRTCRYGWANFWGVPARTIPGILRISLFDPWASPAASLTSSSQINLNDNQAKANDSVHVFWQASITDAWKKAKRRLLWALRKW